MLTSTDDPEKPNQSAEKLFEIHAYDFHLRGTTNLVFGEQPYIQRGDGQDSYECVAGGSLPQGYEKTMELWVFPNPVSSVTNGTVSVEKSHTSYTTIRLGLRQGSNPELKRRETGRGLSRRGRDWKLYTEFQTLSDMPTSDPSYHKGDGTQENPDSPEGQSTDKVNNDVNNTINDDEEIL